MPIVGDSYSVVLKKAHLGWGDYRHTGTRPEIERETYIKIPAPDAYRIGIMREDLFHCTSDDGTFSATLRASGNQDKPGYAKQFHTDGDLKFLATWLIDHCHAKVNDVITVTWLSPTEIQLSYASV